MTIKRKGPALPGQSTTTHARPADSHVNALEQLRDLFDRNDVELILIGMPGFERQLARYPQLYTPYRLRPPIPAN